MSVTAPSRDCEFLNLDELVTWQLRDLRALYLTNFFFGSIYSFNFLISFDRYPNLYPVKHHAFLFRR